MASQSSFNSWIHHLDKGYEDLADLTGDWGGCENNKINWTLADKLKLGAVRQ